MFGLAFLSECLLHKLLAVRWQALEMLATLDNQVIELQLLTARKTVQQLDLQNYRQLYRLRSKQYNKYN